MPQGIDQLQTVQIVTGGGREIETVNVVATSQHSQQKRCNTTATVDPNIRKVRNSGGTVAGLRTIRTS